MWPCGFRWTAQVWEGLRADFELEQRFEAMDYKLELIITQAKFYMEILQNRKSDTLEWIIILLIGAEICVRCERLADLVRANSVDAARRETRRSERGAQSESGTRFRPALRPKVVHEERNQTKAWGGGVSRIENPRHTRARPDGACHCGVRRAAQRIRHGHPRFIADAQDELPSSYSHILCTSPSPCSTALSLATPRHGMGPSPPQM